MSKMKNVYFAYLIRIFFVIVLFGCYCSKPVKIDENQIPLELRQTVNADRNTISTAIELRTQGWFYVPPQPKSRQAAWGNYDGRTTWWYGYWINKKNSKISARIPVKQQDGVYYGDGIDLRLIWRRGGSPIYPSKLELLLSLPWK